MDLYLIDGNSYIYRAFYAIKALSNSKGFPTNAIYGFTSMLLKIIRDKKPDGIVVSFDTSAPTERHRIFEAYKAHRPEVPSELIPQFPYIRKMTAAFNIKIFELPGYEADDLLCTIARKAERDGANVFIVTADKDMLQIVTDRIKIYDSNKDRILDEAYVKEKFGLEPARIPEFMALTGDAADNIPGIKGIGEKTAKELLSNVKDIDELLNHPENIKREKLRSLIIENKEIALLSKRLATLDADVPVDVDLRELTVKEPDWSALLPIFRELEFWNFMKLIPSARQERAYETVYSIDRLKELLIPLKSEFSFELVTADGDAGDCISGLAISHEKEGAFYIPLGHSYIGAPAQADTVEVFKLLAPLFEDAGISKIGHDLKCGVATLKRTGLAVAGVLYDTMLASYLLNPNKTDHRLEDVALEQLSFRKKTAQEILGKRKAFSEIPVEEAALYAAEGAALTMELKEKLFGKLMAEGLDRLYFKVEMPLIAVLIDMEAAGFKVDADKLNAMSKELALELDSIQRRIYFIAGEEFNVNSPKQISRVLFHTLGLKPGKKTKSGFSTELSVLEELAETHELPGEILNYRSLSKLKSTYTDAIPRLITERTGRIHTSFNQTVTATGRLSSSEPNLQNIPIRGEWGKRIRGTFIAEKGNLILSADYSQIELRVLAHLSGDLGLIEAFKSNVDVHARTASELFGVEINMVTPEMRRVAKTVNFGVVYGMSPFGLSSALNIPAGEAKKYIEGYFKRHYGVKNYIEQVIIDARDKGYVLTLFGRKRPMTDLLSKNSNLRAFGERLAVNSPVQGTAADIIKIAMINIWNSLKAESLKTRIILQVHDELVFEAHESELNTVKDMIKEKMEEAVALAVPLRVELGYGRTWAEAHE